MTEEKTSIYIIYITNSSSTPSQLRRTHQTPHAPTFCNNMQHAPSATTNFHISSCTKKKPLLPQPHIPSTRKSPHSNSNNVRCGGCTYLHKCGHWISTTGKGTINFLDKSLRSSSGYSAFRYVVVTAVTKGQSSEDFGVGESEHLRWMSMRIHSKC